MNTEQLIPAERYKSQPYWDDLSKKDQKIADEATQKVGQLAFMSMSSRLQTGKYLIVLRRVLKTNFRDHIRVIRLRERTAYRIIKDYQETEKLVPEKTMPVLMALNYDFGKQSYRSILKKLPAPASADPEVIEPWAEKVEEEHRAKTKVSMARGVKSIDSGSGDYDEQLKESIRFCRIRLHRLPRRGPGWKAAKRRFVTELAGILLTEAEVTESVNVNPTTPPEEYLRGREPGQSLRGRPSEKKEMVN